jgi:putative ABC transport system substrate-binding protein
MIDRRVFVGVIAGGLFASPLGCLAQRAPKIWRIGFLAAASQQDFTDGRLDALIQGMRELGYIEKKNLVIEARYGDGNYDRLPDLAGELVRLKVDVIVAVPSPAIRAAQHATTTIPIVFPSTGDPVGSGFVASLAHPGGNVTGLSNTNLDISAKTLELLMTVAPQMSSIAILANPGSSTAPAIVKSINAAAHKLRVQSVSINASSPEEIESAFATMRRHRPDAIVIAGDAFLNMQAHQIAELAIKDRVPSVTQSPRYARAGGLMSYGQSATDVYRHAAAYIDRIFKGANPGDLPVEQPSKFELVINLRTAKALRLTIPQSLLLRADEVIQ